MSMKVLEDVSPLVQSVDVFHRGSHFQCFHRDSRVIHIFIEETEEMPMKENIVVEKLRRIFNMHTIPVHFGQNTEIQKSICI